ncbi:MULTISPECIES: CheB methylesterase domain-containing protein [Cellulosilyticum]|uniref:protein-glutamate methylesterase n=1 Tax=Cellulosilyticum lentocellum (strain ATCC 49066 / DSM 5427 / NCIMB 11756 / RHM5) TaxID=642492 RepID=F2JGQ0_CELLD|nr:MULTISPECIES: CheB methylesterase domain-containing protein [Cellulosilyticum]ADZ84142.1 CheB methylesterase [Cellulosilyticum lentocellum DSM 5427]QEH69589.1 chemotaxis protein CheB [Cellulosilyticum sp. WCF-2]
MSQISRNAATIEEQQYEYIIAMGISTGGPKLLSQIIPTLEQNLSATYLIVQHMPQGFTKNLAARLNSLSALEVKEAEHEEVLKRGTVYIAPGGKQLKIINGLRPQINITDDLPYKGHKPSVNIMMSSLAELKSCSKKMIAVIMTGMGSDGLEGVSDLKRTYPCEVIAQDQASSTVYGMPKAIANAGLADYIASAENITQIIKRIVGDNHGR